jgi:hypothetical protein
MARRGVSRLFIAVAAKSTGRTPIYLWTNHSPRPPGWTRNRDRSPGTMPWVDAGPARPNGFEVIIDEIPLLDPLSLFIGKLAWHHHVLAEVASNDRIHLELLAKIIPAFSAEAADRGVDLAERKNALKAVLDRHRTPLDPEIAQAVLSSIARQVLELKQGRGFHAIALVGRTCGWDFFGRQRRASAMRKRSMAMRKARQTSRESEGSVAWPAWSSRV